MEESRPQAPWQVGACRLHEHLQMQGMSLANKTAHSALNSGEGYEAPPPPSPPLGRTKWLLVTASRPEPGLLKTEKSSKIIWVLSDYTKPPVRPELMSSL